MHCPLHTQDASWQVPRIPAFQFLGVVVRPVFQPASQFSCGYTGQAKVLCPELFGGSDVLLYSGQFPQFLGHVIDIATGIV